MNVKRILAAIGHDGLSALDELKVRSFERMHEVMLPESYRVFLTQVAKAIRRRK